MADTKLSDLTTGTVPAYVYGEELVTGTPTSRRYPIHNVMGVFNVKEYGAIGDFSHDDTGNIQAAIDAAQTNNGGVVFFPAGRYKVTQSLKIGCGAFTGGGAGITLMGSGGRQDNPSGSTLEGSFHGYIVYSSHLTAQKVLCSVQNLVIKNGATFSFSSVEPPSSPDGVGVSADGGGALYIGSGTTQSVWNCDLVITSGICLYYGGIVGLDVAGTNMLGNYPRNNPPAAAGSANLSFGVVLHCPGSIRSCKLALLGTGVCVWKWGIMCENIDEENCGIGFRLGQNPLSYVDTDLSDTTIQAAESQNSGQDTVLRCVNSESNFIYDVYIKSMNRLTIDCCSFGGFNGDPGAAIYVENGCSLSQAVFMNTDINGTYASFGAGIDFSQGNQVADVIMMNVSVKVNTSAFVASVGPTYRPPVSSAYGTGDNPPVMINCNFKDGVSPGLTVSRLPITAPAHPSLLDTLVTNSTVAGPLFGGSTANIGTTVTAASGTPFKAFVRWNGSNWVISG